MHVKRSKSDQEAGPDSLNAAVFGASGLGGGAVAEAGSLAPSVELFEWRHAPRL